MLTNSMVTDKVSMHYFLDALHTPGDEDEAVDGSGTFEASEQEAEV